MLSPVALGGAGRVTIVAMSSGFGLCIALVFPALVVNPRLFSEMWPGLLAFRHGPQARLTGESICSIKSEGDPSPTRSSGVHGAIISRLYLHNREATAVL